MPQFAYIALDRSGKRTQGTLSAASRHAALDSVTQRGLFPIQVDESDAARPAPASDDGERRAAHVPAAAVEAFTRELANLLAGGVALARALSILQREASHPAARAQCRMVHDDVAGGMSLADALAKHPRSFAPVYVAMVRAGETGGFLDVVLGQIADFRTRERDLLGKVRAALIYPCVLAVLAVAVVIFCLTYFIPKFSGIFAEFGAGLPALTRMVVALSHWFYAYGLLIVLAVVIALIVLQRARQSDLGRRRLERVLLATPRLGTLLSRFALVRFARMLGTLLQSGVPLIAALRVAREAIGNQTLTDAVTRATEDVQRGSSLARSLATTPMLFPPSVIEMIAIAEETGRLDAELTRIAATYEADLDRHLRMLVALAEPIMLFFMAAVIGIIVVAMLLPVFSLQDLIQ